MLPQEKNKKQNKTKKLHLIPPGPSLSALTRAWMFHNTSPHRSQSARRFIIADFFITWKNTKKSDQEQENCISRV